MLAVLASRELRGDRSRWIDYIFTKSHWVMYLVISKFSREVGRMPMGVKMISQVPIGDHVLSSYT